jgi:hypothetical protein
MAADLLGFGELEIGVEGSIFASGIGICKVETLMTGLAD